MRRIELGTVLATAALIVAGSAGAVAQPVPAHNWTGIYGGIHGGVASGRANNDFPPDFGWFDGIFAPQTGDAFRQNFGSKDIIGFHLGANQQIGSWVIGLEGAYSRTQLHASSADPFSKAGGNQLTYETELDWIASITPRLGYAFNNWLIYGKGGFAAGRVSALLTSTSPGTTITFEEHGIHVGWTVGVGIEVALTPKWILGVEYNHYDLGSESFGGYMRRNGFRDEGGQYNLALTADSVTARLSYLWAPDGSTHATAAYASAKTSATRDRGWAGFYVGAHGGYGWANAENAHPDETGFFFFAPEPRQAATFDQSLDGWMAGGHFGLNYQARQWVLGFEGAVTWTGLKGSSTGVFAALGADPAAIYETKLDWLATLTPRLGWDFGQWLPYLKGGLALGQVTSKLSLQKGNMLHPAPQTFQETNNHLGWTAGAGVEYRMSQSWIAGLEYNYVDLGSERYGGHTANGNGQPSGAGEYDVELTSHSVLLRLSYRPFSN